ncbi:MAG: phosphate/phosphite/phosphonate ABC transporter substrate-binding protein [Chloroflexi bacterium]|nr:phosphate/phosphite/phosphonate ABC transporter substrate-binding protein [Chloroflexota bacterium]
MRRLLLFAIVTGLLTGCASTASASIINLNDLQPLPDRPATDVVPLRVAVGAVTSPQGTVDSYAPLLDYLERKLNRPVELVQRRTYAEVNDLVETGFVDVAFVCTSAYLIGQRDFNMQLLAAPEVDGETVYYSVLIVPATSEAHSMADLRGKVFAFTDPMSNTGHNFPKYLIKQLGETAESFFSRTFFTYSHDDAIRAVASGLADGAAVDSLVYDYAIEREPELAQRTKIIFRSEPFGIPPVVAGPQARPQIVAEVRNLLIGMAVDTEGQHVLSGLNIDRFVTVEDRIYDSARQLETQVVATP